MNQPRKNESIETSIVEAIEADISNRRGLGGEWGEIDYEIREDIKNKWKEIIRMAFLKKPRSKRAIVAELPETSDNTEV